jgi:hypothetical protein
MTAAGSAAARGALCRRAARHLPGVLEQQAVGGAGRVRLLRVLQRVQVRRIRLDAARPQETPSLLGSILPCLSDGKPAPALLQLVHVVRQARSR